MSRHLKQRCGGVYTVDPDVPADPLDRTRYALLPVRAAG